MSGRGRGKGRGRVGRGGNVRRGRGRAIRSSMQAQPEISALESMLNEMRSTGKEVGPKDCTYGFPAPVLDYIRSLVPGDIVGEIRTDAYPVTIAEFCTAMEIPQVGQ